MTGTAKMTREPFRGLSSKDVEIRIAEGRTNYLSKKTTRSVWYILRTNLFTYFNIIVIGSCFVLFGLGQWRDALFGLAAIASVIIGVVQEYRSKRLLDKLVLLHSPKANVVRNWRKETIDLDDIVLDDVLYLSIGDQVPADSKVLASQGLEANEALLTGEVDPVSKSNGDEVMSGSIIVAGSAYARVVKVGTDSYASRLTADAKRFSLVHSELRAGIDKVLKFISIMIVPIFVIVVIGQIQAAGGWEALKDEQVGLKAAVGGVASIVSMIPLGLVLITSVTFAVGAVRLLKHRVLMQELAAVEGLARADVVCFDKTGTLTEGEIIFDRVVTIGKPPKNWQKILGWFASDEHANATMKSLAVPFPESVKDTPSEIIAFSSSRKWSAAAFASGAYSGSWAIGAPEKLIDDVNEANNQTLDEIAKMTDEGRRALVLCYSPEDFKHTKLTDETIKDAFVPVVVIALKETLREDVLNTLNYLKKQGVEIRLLSGDNPRTVAAIARDAGIVFDGDGYDARKLPVNIDELGVVLDEHIVFGRVDPDQKKDIVMALQARGHVVAMVGDGVNDAMAVKQSDIGVAMGSGSAATRAVARLVLLDSDFSQFPRVIDAGRQVIANIERVSLLFLSKTMYIMTLSIVFGLTFWGFPFLPRHLSAVDGLTIGMPAFALALMPSSRRYLPGFLERTLRLAIPNGLIVAAGVIAVKIFVTQTGPYSDGVPATSMAIVMGLIGLWILITQSRPFNKSRLAIAASMYIGLAGVMLIPITKNFFFFVIPEGELLYFTLIVGFIGSVLVELVDKLLRVKI